jgi:hypothetical protein
MRNIPPPGIGGNQQQWNQSLSVNVPGGLGSAWLFSIMTGPAVKPFGGAGYSDDTADVISPILGARTRQALVPGMKGYDATYGGVRNG